MSSPNNSQAPAPLDLSRWRSLPSLLIVVGGLLTVVGAFTNYKQFTFSWLLAFMFFLSLCLGGLGMVILHHLFDASWSVPIRRFCEHLACLLPVMAVLFIPIAANVLFASPDNVIYAWVRELRLHHINGANPIDDSLAAKQPLFTVAAFIGVAVINFVVWTILSRGLRKWSLEQDKTGAAICTRMMRRYSAVGVVLFALTLTLGAIMWMKALEHEWFSTMYGVYYFASSMWVTIFTIYAITALLQRQGPLREIVSDKTFYFIGSLMFAFTVFYAYVTFFQYFIIWNANMPEETFWFNQREVGTWFGFSMIIIFGHFFLPFLTLLRIDFKLQAWLMIPLCLWAWLMHFVDISFNIVPVLHPAGYWLDWRDLACLAFIGGILATVFLKFFNAHPPFPQQDPRIAETMDVHISNVHVATDEYVEAATARGTHSHEKKRGGH